MKDEKKPSINFRKLISRFMMAMMAYRWLKSRRVKVTVDQKEANV